MTCQFQRQYKGTDFYEFIYSLSETFRFEENTKYLRKFLENSSNSYNNYFHPKDLSNNDYRNMLDQNLGKAIKIFRDFFKYITNLNISSEKKSEYVEIFLFQIMFFSNILDLF